MAPIVEDDFVQWGPPGIPGLSIPCGGSSRAWDSGESSQGFCAWYVLRLGGREYDQRDADDNQNRHADQLSAPNHIAERLCTHPDGVHEAGPGGKSDEAAVC